MLLPSTIPWMPSPDRPVVPAKAVAARARSRSLPHRAVVPIPFVGIQGPRAALPYTRVPAIPPPVFPRPPPIMRKAITALRAVLQVRARPFWRKLPRLRPGTWMPMATYTPISTTTSCSSPGAGYTATVLPLGDCNDANAAINPETIWYADADGDGLGDPNAATPPRCDPPTDITHVLNNTDQCPGH